MRDSDLPVCINLYLVSSRDPCETLTVHSSVLSALSTLRVTHKPRFLRLSYLHATQYYGFPYLTPSIFLPEDISQIPRPSEHIPYSFKSLYVRLTEDT
jgi:hypothetical protein